MNFYVWNLRRKGGGKLMLWCTTSEYQQTFNAHTESDTQLAQFIVEELWKQNLSRRIDPLAKLEQMIKLLENL